MELQRPGKDITVTVLSVLYTVIHRLVGADQQVFYSVKYQPQSPDQAVIEIKVLCQKYHF